MITLSCLRPNFDKFNFNEKKKWKVNCQFFGLRPVLLIGFFCACLCACLDSDSQSLTILCTLFPPIEMLICILVINRNQCSIITQE